MTEQLLNRTRGALAFAMQPGDTTATIVDDTGWPVSTSGGNFRINVDGEIMLVTAIAGTTLSVDRAQEGTVAVTHPVGTPVAIVPTAAALSNYIDAYVVELQNQINIIGQNQIFPETSTYAGGADPTGVTDSAAALNAAFNAAAGGNGIVILSGKYLCNSQLLLKAGVHIHFQSFEAQLIKNYASANGGALASFIASVDGSGNICNAAGTGGKANDIKITGNGKITTQVVTNIGNVISIYGDRFIFTDFVIDTWGGGRAIFGAGDKWRSYSISMRNSDGNVGSGGLRYAGGQGSTFVALDIISGDDCLQFVPGGGTTGTPLFDISITNSWYIGCTGQSISARFMVAALQNSGILGSPGSFGGMHSVVKYCGWIGCHGFGGARATCLQCRDSDGMSDGSGIAFDHIHFTECSVDMTNTNSYVTTGNVSNGVAQITNIPDTSPIEAGQTIAGSFITGGTTVLSVDSPTQITMSTNATNTLVGDVITVGGLASMAWNFRPASLYASVGRCRNIYYNKFEVINPQGTKSTMQFNGGTWEDVVMEDCVLPTGSNATLTGNDLGGIHNCRIIRGRYDMGNIGNVTGAMRLGNATNPGTNYVLDGPQFLNIPNSPNLQSAATWAIQWNQVTGGMTRNCFFSPAGGTTTAQSIQVGSACSNITIAENDMSNMPITSTNINISNSATGIVVYNNIGDNSFLGFDMFTQSFSSGPQTLTYGPTVILTDTTSGAFTINLPGSASVRVGQRFWFIDTTSQWATHNLTIGRSGKNIDGAAANVVLSNAGGKVMFYYDGTQWWTLGGNNLNNSVTPLADGTATIGTSYAVARADHIHPATPVATTSLTNRYYYLQGTKSTIALTSATVSKMNAVRVPYWMWGRTCTGLALNYTVAAILGAGTAVSATLRMALVADSSGSPGTAIISGTEVSADMTVAATAAGGTFTGVVIPNNCWCIIVCETPTGAPALGTLGTYPTWDIVNTNLEGISPSASPITAGTAVNEYTESGQTTFTGTLAGMTLPAMTNAAANAPRVQFKLT